MIQTQHNPHKRAKNNKCDYWEVYGRFQGDVFGWEGYVGGSLDGGICHGGRGF